MRNGALVALLLVSQAFSVATLLHVAKQRDEFKKQAEYWKSMSFGRLQDFEKQIYNLPCGDK